MEKALNDYLREGERVLWQGKTEPFPLLDNATKFQILTKWILTVALGGGLLVTYFRGNEVRSISYIAIVAAVAVIIMISPLMERHSLAGQSYWITDQRAILMSRDKTFYYMELEELDGYRLVQDVASQDCLVLGSGIFEEIHKQLRWRSCHPKIDLQGHSPQDCVMGMVFYCTDHLDAAVALLERQTHSHAA